MTNATFLASLLVLFLAPPIFAGERVTIEAGSYVPFFSGDARQAVRVDRFQMNRKPVTRGEFLAFVRSHPEWRRSQAKRVFAEAGYLSDWSGDLDPGHAASLGAPVTRVSWFAARAYCEAAGGSLPSTDQWEFAAFDRGQGPEEARTRSLEWYSRPNDREPPSAAKGPRNGYGLYGFYDLVWEWTDDFDSAMDATGASRFDCGAASLEAIDPADYAAFMRYSYRSSLKATYATANLGFRCVSGGGP
jgi:formylglycine-generating enzyme required for sulfatase activity